MSSGVKNLIIVIPSYNSNTSLSKLLDQIDKEIIVIDDGSREAFSTNLDNVEVLRNDKNKGKGFSLQKGFKHAQSRGYSHVISLDADFQHNPKEIDKFTDISEDIDFVLGYRKRDKSMPIHRRFSNSVTSFIISKLTNKDILDSQCGFRRYNLDLVNSFYYKENGFQFESEVLIKCLNDNTSMTQIKIETIYDKNNKSYINHVSDTLKFIKLILKSLIKR